MLSVSAEGRLGAETTPSGVVAGRTESDHFPKDIPAIRTTKTVVDTLRAKMRSGVLAVTGRMSTGNRGAVAVNRPW